MKQRPSPRGNGRRRDQLATDHPTASIVLATCDAEATDEVVLRVEAATALLAYALVGLLPLDDAAAGALRHLQRVELLMRAAA
jgi:hypothetical protein